MVYQNKELNCGLCRPIDEYIEHFISIRPRLFKRKIVHRKEKGTKRIERQKKCYDIIIATKVKFSMIKVGVP